MILGIRNYSKGMRYAILNQNGEFINQNSENRLIFPVGYNTYEEKLEWLYRELERIYANNLEITKIAIKENEYTRMGEKNTSRENAGYDAITVLFAKQKNIPVEVKLYTHINTTSKKVKSDAEANFNALKKHWDEKIADALMVAKSCEEV